MTYTIFLPMIFVKNIFDCSQTVAQILKKFALYMQLNKVSQVCLNQVCMNYFHGNMLMNFLSYKVHSQNTMCI